MKKTLGLLTISVLSTALFTGCPGDSGKGASVGLGNSGQVGGYGQIGPVNSFANESCDIQANTYNCTQTINGQVFTTPTITFNSQQEFCSKITDFYSNVDYRGQAIAQNTRNELSRIRCAGVGQNNTTPGGTPVMGFKTFKCSLEVRKGSATFPQQTEQFYLPDAGGQVTLFANSMANRRIWNFLNYSRSVNLARVTMEYKPAFLGSALAMDQIKMTVNNIDGDISTSMIGYAGAENKIEVTPQDEELTQLAVSCISLDATVKPTANVSDKYACVGTERTKGKTNQINYVNQISDVVSSGISLSNAVFVQGQDGTQLGANSVMFSQTSNGYDESTVNVKSNLSSLTALTIDKLGYSLKVKCSPK